jgi:hypothetical protein
VERTAVDPDPLVTPSPEDDGPLTGRGV